MGKSLAVFVPPFGNFSAARQTLVGVTQDIGDYINNLPPSTNMLGSRVINVGDPVNSQDAVNLEYLQNSINNIPQATINQQIATASSTGTGGIFPTTQTLITGSRSLGVVYRNTAATPMTVLVTIELESVSASPSQVKLMVDSNPAPATIIGELLNQSTTITIFATMTFIVLPMFYYEILQIQPACSVVTWTEWV